MELLELTVKQPLTVRVDGMDYRVEFPLSAVIRLEDKLGRPMRAPADWFKMQTKELPAVLEAGLSKCHRNTCSRCASAGRTPCTVRWHGFGHSHADRCSVTNRRTNTWSIERRGTCPSVNQCAKCSTLWT